MNCPYILCTFMQTCGAPARVGDTVHKSLVVYPNSGYLLRSVITLLAYDCHEVTNKEP